MRLQGLAFKNSMDHKTRKGRDGHKTVVPLESVEILGKISTFTHTVFSR